MDNETERLAMEAAIKKEEAKIKRCERMGIRHKNRLGDMVEAYKKFCLHQQQYL